MKPTKFAFRIQWAESSQLENQQMGKSGRNEGISLPKKKFEGSRKTRKDKGRPRKTKKDKEGDSAYIFLQIKESYCPFLSAKYNNELPMR